MSWPAPEPAIQLVSAAAQSWRHCVMAELIPPQLMRILSGVAALSLGELPWGYNEND
jgi:hypothetical protein